MLRMFARLAVCLSLSLPGSAAEAVGKATEIEAFFKALPEDAGAAFFHYQCGSERLTRNTRDALRCGLFGLSDTALKDERILATYEAFWNARDSVEWKAGLVLLLGNAYYRHGDLGALIDRWTAAALEGSTRDALYLTIAYSALLETHTARKWAEIAVQCPFSDEDFWSVATSYLAPFGLYDESFFRRVLETPAMPAWLRFSLLSRLGGDRSGDIARAMAALHPDMFGDFAPALSQDLKALPWRETVDALHRYADGQDDPVRSAKPRLLLAHLMLQSRLDERAADLAWETFTSLYGNGDIPSRAPLNFGRTLPDARERWQAETEYFRALEHDLGQQQPFRTGILREDTTGRCLQLEALRLCSLIAGPRWTSARLEYWFEKHPGAPEELTLFSVAAGTPDALPRLLSGIQTREPGYIRTLCAAVPVLLREYRLPHAFRRDLYDAVEKLGDQAFAAHPHRAREMVPNFYEAFGLGLLRQKRALETCGRWDPTWKPGVENRTLDDWREAYPMLFEPAPPARVMLDAGEKSHLPQSLRGRERRGASPSAKTLPDPLPWAARFQANPAFSEPSHIGALREIARKNAKLPPAIRIRLLSLHSPASAFSHHLERSQASPSLEPVPLSELELLLTEMNDEDSRLLLAQHLALADAVDWQRVLDLALPSSEHPGSYGAVANYLIGLAAEKLGRGESADAARTKFAAMVNATRYPRPRVPPLDIAPAPAGPPNWKERESMAKDFDFMKAGPDRHETLRREADTLRETALQLAQSGKPDDALRTWNEAQAKAPLDWVDEAMIRALTDARRRDAALDVFVAGMAYEFDFGEQVAVRRRTTSPKGEGSHADAPLVGEALQRMRSEGTLAPFLNHLKALLDGGFEGSSLYGVAILASAVAADDSLPELMAEAASTHSLPPGRALDAFTFIPRDRPALRASAVARLEAEADEAPFAANLESARIANAAQDFPAAARILEIAWQQASADERREASDHLLHEALDAGQLALADKIADLRLNTINEKPGTATLSEATLRDLGRYIVLLHRSERQNFARHIMDRVLALPTYRPMTANLAFGAILLEVAVDIRDLDALDALLEANPELARQRASMVFLRHSDLLRGRPVGGELVTWLRPDGKLAWDAGAVAIGDKEAVAWRGDLADVGVGGQAEILAGASEDALESVLTLENYPARGERDIALPAGARFMRIIRRAGPKVAISESRRIMVGENRLRFDRCFDTVPAPPFRETLSIGLFDEPLDAEAVAFDPRNDYLLEGWIRLDGNWLNHRFRIGLRALDENGEPCPGDAPELTVSHRDSLWHYVSVRINGPQVSGNALTLTPVFSFMENAMVGQSNDRSVTLADFSLVSATDPTVSASTPPITRRLPHGFFLAAGTPPLIAFSREGEILELETPEAATVNAPLRLREVLPFPEGRKLVVAEDGTLFSWTPGTADFIRIKGKLEDGGGSLLVSPDLRWLAEFSRQGRSPSTIRLHALANNEVVHRHDIFLPLDDTIPEVGFATDDTWRHSRLLLQGLTRTTVIDPETKQEETRDSRVPWPAGSVTLEIIPRRQQGTPTPRWHRGDGRSLTSRLGENVFYALSLTGAASGFRTPDAITSTAADISRNQWITLESNGALRFWPFDALFPNQPITNNE